MPKHGKHTHNALTAVQVRNLGPGRHPDGGGLYLEVEDSGARHWILRTMVHGKRKDIGLGGVSWVTLAEARERASKLRKIARDGGDPLSERRRQQEIPTFDEAARTVHADRAATYRNPKHAAQWVASLQTYASPHIGAMRVNIIDSPDVLRVLTPIWQKKPETARRVKQRINVVLNWAKAQRHRTGDNPVSAAIEGLKKHDKNGKAHHAALPYKQVSGFMERLRAEKGTAARALEFTILTAGRTGEVIAAKPDEFDIKAALWTVPPRRMKAGRAHRVPLAPSAIDLVKEYMQSDWIFPGMKDGEPISNMAMLKLLERMGHAGLTVHGFRSTFRDWAAEQTNFPRDVCEMALAHTVRDATEAAYRRGDLFEKRRELMQHWARYCNQKPAKGAKVTPIRKTG